MQNREYIKTGKLISLPDSRIKTRAITNDIWKNQVFFHLLNFYKNCNITVIHKIIEIERNKPQARIEDKIGVFIRNTLRIDIKFNSQGFRIAGGVNNDEEIRGFYDISIFHSDWVNIDLPVDFHFECKNLDGNQELVNKYVYYNTYENDKNNQNIFDGGVFRYFNGKYAQNLDFGGMIGFVLDGKVLDLKSKIATKLNDKFSTSPDGDLIKITDNSIQNNDFTFDSYHKRFSKEFILHHLLFDFSE